MEGGPREHSHIANSGIGIIVGEETGKILHLGVQNKYCWVCSRADSMVKEHQLILASMENDTILKVSKLLKKNMDSHIQNLLVMVIVLFTVL